MRESGKKNLTIIRTRTRMLTNTLTRLCTGARTKARLNTHILENKESKHQKYSIFKNNLNNMQMSFQKNNLYWRYFRTKLILQHSG